MRTLPRTASDQTNTTRFRKPNSTKGVDGPKVANSQPPPRRANQYSNGTGHTKKADHRAAPGLWRLLSDQRLAGHESADFRHTHHRQQPVDPGRGRVIDKEHAQVDQRGQAGRHPILPPRGSRGRQ